MTPFLRKRLRRQPIPPKMSYPAKTGRARANVAALAPGGRVPVAVIVIARDGEAFLAECLDSVFAQTVTPDEIVFVNDASKDGTLTIAESYQGRGLKIVSRAVAGGMNVARMDGLAETTAPLLLFVDGDNALPGDYLATMAAELGDLDFVYPSKRFIGSPEALNWSRRWHPGDDWTPPGEASRARLWQANECDTCSLLRREAFMRAGGWRNNMADNMSDWELFLRMSRTGRFAPSSARLLYRLHDNNWSLRDRGKDRATIFGQVRRAAATLTVATMWSGRRSELQRRWLSAVEEALWHAGCRAELLVMDDSPKGFNLPAVSRDVFPWVNHRRVRRGNVGTEERRPDRRATAEFLAGICNEILDSARGDVIWFVEDDIFPPAEAAERLLLELLQAPDAPRAAVAGAYRSRHPGQEHWIAADYVGGKVEHWTALGAGPMPAPLTGTGCLMVLRDALAGARFALEWQHDGKRSPAHDWAFSWELYQRGTPVMLIPDVICEHVA